MCHVCLTKTTERSTDLAPFKFASDLFLPVKFLWGSVLSKDLYVWHRPWCGMHPPVKRLVCLLLFLQYHIIYANICTTVSTYRESAALQNSIMQSDCGGSARKMHQFVHVIKLSQSHMTVHSAHTVWVHSAWLLLAPVGACVPSLVWVMLPACQCCSSPLVLCCTTMVLLEPAVRSILWRKSVHSLVLGLSIAPLVQLLHQDILTQNRCILLVTTLHKHLHNQQKQCWGSVICPMNILSI